uniref:Uncharacterized protein n=1 Tax=Arundo donax TaxID=35708 RepID=A0A0A9TME9_ARUDO
MLPLGSVGAGDLEGAWECSR